jgi:hypothetical protein
MIVFVENFHRIGKTNLNMSVYGEYNVRKRKDKDKSQVKTSEISEGLSNGCTGALMEREKKKKDSAE